jgi:hypothetical protein
MYRPPYRPPYYGGGYYGNRRPGGNTFVNNGNININTGNGNIYNNKRGGVSTRNIDRTSIGNNNSKISNNNIGNNIRPNNKPVSNNSRPNNIFSDRDGNVFQKDNKTNNWNQRDNKTNQWKPSTDNNRMKDLDRDFKARDRSNSRDRNFNNFQNNRQASPSNRMPASRPAGGGGRGRRG